MSLDMRVPSITEMREFVTEYLKSRHFNNEVFDDETITEMYNEVNSKYRE